MRVSNPALTFKPMGWSSLRSEERPLSRTFHGATYNGDGGRTMETLFKAYVYKNMFSDLAKFVRRSAKRVDFDADSWLHRVGLTTYRPVRVTISGTALLLLGAAAGVAVGLALAPKPGSEFRAEVKEKAQDMLDSMSKKAGIVETETPKVRGRAHA
jgi:hypothetical protein